MSETTRPPGVSRPEPQFYHRLYLHYQDADNKSFAIPAPAYGARGFYRLVLPATP